MDRGVDPVFPLGTSAPRGEIETHVPGETDCGHNRHPAFRAQETAVLQKKKKIFEKVFARPWGLGAPSFIFFPFSSTLYDVTLLKNEKRFPSTTKNQHSLLPSPPPFPKQKKKNKKKSESSESRSHRDLIAFPHANLCAQPSHHQTAARSRHHYPISGGTEWRQGIVHRDQKFPL